MCVMFSEILGLKVPNFVRFSVGIFRFCVFQEVTGLLRVNEVLLHSEIEEIGEE